MSRAIFQKEWGKEQVWKSRFIECMRFVCTVMLCGLIIGLFGQVAIPLPFTPIPLVVQGSMVIVLSCFLGSKKAAASVLVFLAQGACGLPVFANGGYGITTLMGPRGGYLVGYLVAAYIVGFLTERMREKTLPKMFGAMALGNCALLLCGMCYFATFVGFKHAFLLGVAPFLFGDFVKLLCSVKCLQWWNRVAQK